MKKASARRAPASRSSRTVSSRNGCQLRFPKKIGSSIPCARSSSSSAAIRSRFCRLIGLTPAEELVVVRHLLEPLARDVAPARHVLEEGHHVVHSLGPAEGDDEQRVVAPVIRRGSAPSAGCCASPPRHRASVAPEPGSTDRAGGRPTAHVLTARNAPRSRERWIQAESARAAATMWRAVVAVAQLVEPRVVVPVVAGSSPVRHPS